MNIRELTEYRKTPETDAIEKALIKIRENGPENNRTADYREKYDFLGDRSLTEVIDELTAAR